MVNQFYDPEEFQPREVVDYREIINRQIEACRKLLTYASNEYHLETAEYAVEVFESMLIDMDRENYLKELKELNDEHKDEIKTLSERERKLNNFKMRRKYVRRKFELLIKLATRQGFTVIKDTKVVI